MRYIGARYVIKIYENSNDPSSAEWEAGVTYEPLTMVTYQNGSYLSKKNIPGTIGDPAANPLYWVQTGFYNGQIASLQAQIDAINNIIDSIGNNENNGLSAFQIDDGFRFMSGYSDLSPNLSSYGMQGSCYNTLSHTFLLGFIDGSGNAIIVETQSDLTTVIREHSYINNQLGHLNDITYNPITNKYVIAGYDAINPTFNGVYIIDGTTLDYEDTIVLPPVISDPNDAIGKIAFDADKNIYYMLSNTYLNIFDKDFNLVESHPFSLPDFKHTNWVNVGMYPCQSMDLFNDKLACVYSVWNGGNQWSGCVVLYNTDGTLFTTYTINVPISTCELEAICTVDDHLIVIAGGSVGVFTSKIYLQTEATTNAAITPYQSPAPIGNVDLNDVKTCGIYFIDNGTTRINSPFKNDYILFVISGVAGFLQIAVQVSQNGFIAWRRCNYLGNWTVWNGVNNPLLHGISNKVFNGQFNGFVSNSGLQCNVYVPIGNHNVVTNTDITVNSLALFTVVDGSTVTYDLNSVNIGAITMYENAIQIQLLKQDGTQFASGACAACFVGSINLSIA